MRRIIGIGSQPGDIVLDCFAGSGTTAAVAHKMGRRWVTVEWSSTNIERFTLPRLEKVVAGNDPGGVTTLEVATGDGLPEGLKTGEAKTAARVLTAMFETQQLDGIGLDESVLKSLTTALRDVEKVENTTVWEGGGGFRVLRVATSMFEADGGMVFLADAMTNGRLAEATAAQLGFDYEPEPPFVGRKGRARLAVVDGVANEGVVNLLAVALAEDERVVVCGTGIDPDARALLKKLAPGSTLRKIPAALLDRYRASEAAARAARARATETTPAEAQN